VCNFFSLPVLVNKVEYIITSARTPSDGFVRKRSGVVCHALSGDFTVLAVGLWERWRTLQPDRSLACGALTSLHWLRYSERIQYKLATRVVSVTAWSRPTVLIRRPSSLGGYPVAATSAVRVFAAARRAAHSSSDFWRPSVRCCRSDVLEQSPTRLCVTDIILPETENFFVFYIISTNSLYFYFYLGHFKNFLCMYVCMYSVCIDVRGSTRSHLCSLYLIYSMQPDKNLNDVLRCKYARAL